MSFQFYNNWPYSASTFPTMDDHIDPVNNTYFSGLHKEISDIEFFLGLQPQGSFANVASRLSSLETLASRKTYQCIVSPDGSNADYANIQDAIIHVASLGGGTVFIRSGIYIIDYMINIPITGNITLLGEGRGTILKPRNVGYSFIGSGDLSTWTPNISLMNLTFDGSLAVAPFENFLFMLSTDRLSVINCIFQHCGSVAIDMYQSRNALFLRCTFNDMFNIYVRDQATAYNNMYIGCTFDKSSSGGEGFLMYGKHNIISNCTFKGMGYNIQCAGQRNIFSNNVFVGWAVAAIYLQNSDLNIVNNNTFEGTAGGTILCELSNNCQISGNTFKNSYDYFIKLYGSRYFAISNNTFIVDPGSGHPTGTILLIVLSGIYSMFNSLVGNILNLGHVSYGITENESGDDYNIYVANNVQDYVGAGISISGANSVKANNIEHT